jgi:hypothetical protein
MEFLMKQIALALSASCIALIGTASAQNIPEPGGTAADQVVALTNPDEFAWRLFFFLNRPAKAGSAGIADDTRMFGDVAGAAPMVWETWAMASGGPASEVYKPDGSRPDDWDKLKRNERLFVLDRNLENESVRSSSRRVTPSNAGAFFPTRPANQEVRMNRATFEFIVQDEMYNRDGLEALYAKGVASKNRALVQFPAGAKEVKAQWLSISDDQKPRYLWRESIAPDGTRQAFGLVSLHVITKDLPNWFWADFGHIDCEAQLNACTGQEPALTEPSDSTTRSAAGGPGPAGANDVRNETRNTVWANYILRGTQINFVLQDGLPSILSNPVIEGGFQRSSCMTCHARAAVGPRLLNANGAPVQQINRLSTGDPDIGAPNPALFGDGTGFSRNDILYLQSDFLWSPIFRAQRKR